MAQELAYMAMGTGVLEANSRGFGFVNDKWKEQYAKAEDRFVVNNRIVQCENDKKLTQFHTKIKLWTDMVNNRRKNTALVLNLPS